MRKIYFYNFEFRKKLKPSNLCHLSDSPQIIHNYSSCIFCIHNVGLLKSEKGILCDSNEVKNKYEKKYLLLETVECL